MSSFNVGDRVRVLGKELPKLKGRTGTVTRLNVQGPRKRFVRHAVTVDFWPHEDPRHMPSPRFAFKETDLERET
jgi:hypothetical protein